jgi:threonylcarbamoyladenosine tRNA methylthiotransferase MtaB
MNRFAIHTLGCKVNQFESDCLQQRLVRAGWIPVSFGEEAEVYVVNTCAVTAEGQRQSAQMLRSARRRRPEARVIAAGCAVQVYPDYFKKIEGLDAAIGNFDKIGVVWARIVEGKKSRNGTENLTPPDSPLDLECPVPARRSRVLLRIQEGCDSRCSYCLVPAARGPARSLAPENVLEGLRRLARQGVPEIILTGIHLGQYGRDLGSEWSLTALLRRVLREPDLPRLRLSSLEMEEITPDLIALFQKERRLCPHLHIPLQSGDDRILAAMNRSYTTADYKKLLRRLRETMPLAALGADVIVGFPGEDEASCQRTLDFLTGLPLSYLHVFPFSPRPGTPAACFPNQVPSALRKERARFLRELDREMRRRFLEQNVGQEAEAVVLGSAGREGLVPVLTENYLTVQVQGPLGSGEIIRVRITGCLGPDLVGERVAG